MNADKKMVRNDASFRSIYACIYVFTEHDDESWVPRVDG